MNYYYYYQCTSQLTSVRYTSDGGADLNSVHIRILNIGSTELKLTLMAESRQIWRTGPRWLPALAARGRVVTVDTKWIHSEQRAMLQSLRNVIGHPMIDLYCSVSASPSDPLCTPALCGRNILPCIHIPE